ncbi:MAG: CRP-like cAMP-binding protein [Gammaproteobacteria bacterium]|jgi:CRP-like cAMP-binding protein
MNSGSKIASLKSGDFIGEMSFLSKKPASTSAEAPNLVQYAYWTHDDLAKLKIMKHQHLQQVHRNYWM